MEGIRKSIHLDFLLIRRDEDIQKVVHEFRMAVKNVVHPSLVTFDLDGVTRSYSESKKEPSSCLFSGSRELSQDRSKLLVERRKTSTVIESYARSEFLSNQS